MAIEQPLLYAINAQEPTASAEVEPAFVASLTPQPIIAILDSAFDLLRAHFRPILLTAGLLYFPCHLACFYLSLAWLRPELLKNLENSAQASAAVYLNIFYKSLLVGGPQSAIPGFLSFLFLVTASGPVGMLILSILLGHPYSLGNIMRQGLKKAGSFFALALVALGTFIGTFFAFVMGYSVVVSILGFLLTKLFPGDVVSVALNVLVVLGGLLGYFAAMGAITKYLLFAIPIVLYEGLPLMAVWERNSKLIGFFRFFRLWIALAFLIPLLFILQFIALTPLQSAFSLAFVPDVLQQPILAFLSFVATLLSYVYLLIVIVRLYLDYRVRREALDLRLWAQQLYPKKEGHV